MVKEKRLSPILEQIDYMLNKLNRSEEYIMERLNIDKRSFAAYKAHLSRKAKLNEREEHNLNFDDLEQLNRCFHNCIIIPREYIKKLGVDNIQSFFRVIKNLFENVGNLEDKVKDTKIDDNSGLSKEEIKSIVLEYKREGKSNSEIYKDSRLKEVKEYVIRGILAAHSRGAYN